MMSDNLHAAYISFFETQLIALGVKPGDVAVLLKPFDDTMTIRWKRGTSEWHEHDIPRTSLRPGMTMFENELMTLRAKVLMIG